MKARIIALASVLSLPFFCSCSPDPPLLVVSVLDGSGSFSYYEAAKEKLAPKTQNQFYTYGVAGCLPRESVFSLMRITGRAEEADTLIPPWRVDFNEYDPNTKLASRRALSEAIWAQQSLATYGTDVVGAIYRASLVLQNPQYAGMEKWLLIFSDLGDTENRNFQPDLTGVRVRVLFFSPDLEPETQNAFKPDPMAWANRLVGWDAQSVKVIDVDNSYCANPLS